MKNYSRVFFHSRWLPFFLSAGLFWVGAHNQLTAVTVPDELIAEQLDSATLVADISVNSVGVSEDTPNLIKSTAQATILKIHKQEFSQAPVEENDTIEIEFIGGESNQRGLMVSGFPRPYKGQSYKAYLAPLAEKRSSKFVIVGFEDGLIPLNNLRKSSRNRTDGSDGTGTGPFLYWDTKYFPIPYLISAPSFKNHPDFVTAIEESFQPWRNYEDVLVEFIAMGCNISTKNENDSLNTIILVKNDWPFDSRAIAVTRNFYISGTGSNAGMILDSDILLNNINFSFTTTGEAGKHDIQNIVTHEIGHFLGFGHEIEPKDEDATMYASAVAGETKKRDLATNDVSILRASYPGVGTKFPDQNLHCDVSNETVGCLAVHQTNKNTQSYWALLAYLIFTLGIGKWMAATSRSKN